MGQVPHKNRLVLIIDDEEAVRDAVSDILQFEGVDVITAVDGEAGLNEYTTHKEDVDLVLLDLSMPGMSGAETFEKLKQIDPEAKIILSSGFDEVEATQRFVGQGLAGFLQKPYKMKHLVTKVREYLE